MTEQPELINIPVYIWDLNPDLSKRLRQDLKAKSCQLIPLPSRENWGALPEEEELAVAIIAPGMDDLPWDSIDELKRQRRIRLLLLLPEVDGRTWQHLTSRGFCNVLAPPFNALDLEFELRCQGRKLPLTQRLPDLEARLRTRVEFTFPAEMRFVTPAAGFICRLAREHAYHSDVWAERLPLALGEAFANAVRHGCGSDPSKEVSVKIWIQQDVLKIRVEDPGKGFDYRALPDPRSGTSLKRAHGRGVLLMREMMDRVSFAEGGRIITMHIQRGGR
ncbi:MAG: ATP-binding protein [bacterium]|nr:ATP-binding protein [bacterium]